MAMYITERLVVESVGGGREFEVFINSNNEIYIGNEYAAITLNKSDWDDFKDYIDSRLSSIEETKNEQ